MAPLASSDTSGLRADIDFINHIPDEILSQIYTLAYVSSPQYSKSRNPLACEALPRIIRLVCKRWRVIAESTKPLWLEFEITPDSKPGWVKTSSIFDSAKRAHVMLEEWLRFACPEDGDSRGLRFLFEASTEFSPVEIEILIVLVEHSDCWQRACFDMLMRATVLLGPIHGRLGRLESLDLDLQRDLVDEIAEIDFGTRAFPASLAAALRYAPRLTRLSSYGFWEENDTIQINLPFHQLKHICVVDKRPLDSYHLLRRSAASVEIATITPISKDPAAIWPAQPLPDPPVVRLEALRRLMYLNDHDDTLGPKCGDIFRSLEVPNLQALILYDPAGRSSYHEAFEMLLRSGCKTLKRLDMRGAYLNPLSDIVDLLDFTGDTLESLYVDGVLNTVFSQYRRQRGTGTTAAIIADLATRMEKGLMKLKKLNFRLKVSNVEYLGILGFEKLFRAVLKRNETVTLVLRVSGSSLCVKQLTRELEGPSSGVRTGGKVIIEAV
ncbi:hypothetical protein PM082_018693 [Marasmius tenuissimus]|nr:hypothetical protein PM082_018693 [Marasmius tenuissimus]